MFYFYHYNTILILLRKGLCESPFAHTLRNILIVVPQKSQHLKLGQRFLHSSIGIGFTCQKPEFLFLYVPNNNFPVHSIDYGTNKLGLLAHKNGHQSNEYTPDVQFQRGIQANKFRR